MSRPPAPPGTRAPVRAPAMPQRTAPVRPLPAREEPLRVRSAREDRRAIREAVRRRRRAEAAERVRPIGRRGRLVAAAGAGVLVLLVGLPLLLAFGPVFPVRTVAVSGASGTLAAQVRQALAGEVGRPVALVADADVARALRAVPGVERFTLVRRPPSTIEVAVVPRTPVAQERTAAGWAQVDAAHVTVATSAAPSTMPVVTVSGAVRPERAYAAAVTALEAWSRHTPAATEVRATSPDDVVLRLAGGVTVRWGGADAPAAKAEALQAALRRAAKGATRIDVSSPGVVLTR